MRCVDDSSRDECASCLNNHLGRCGALADTRWLWLQKRKICPFYYDVHMRKKDEKLLDKAIAEGRVNVEKYG